MLLPACATRALTASLSLPDSSAEQRSASPPGPTITGVLEGDRLFEAAFTAPTSGPTSTDYEFSADNGVT